MAGPHRETLNDILAWHFPRLKPAQRKEFEDDLRHWIKKTVIRPDEHLDGGYMAPVRNQHRAEMRRKLDGLPPPEPRKPWRPNKSGIMVLAGRIFKIRRRSKYAREKNN